MRPLLLWVESEVVGTCWAAGWEDCRFETFGEPSFRRKNCCTLFIMNSVQKSETKQLPPVLEGKSVHGEIWGGCIFSVHWFGSGFFVFSMNDLALKHTFPGQKVIINPAKHFWLTDGPQVADKLLHHTTQYTWLVVLGLPIIWTENSRYCSSLSGGLRKF